MDIHSILDDMGITDLISSLNTFKNEQTFENGVKVTGSGATHSYTWQYNSTTNSLDLVYV